MIDKAPDQITVADIQRLVSDGVQEDRTIEFKRELPGHRDSDKKEFLADVSSFANATGGDLIYGVEEKEGRAIAAEGLVIANVDLEQRRLDQLIRDGLNPRIVGYRVQLVPGLSKGPGIVIRVPRSYQAPHIVSFQRDFRFYSRSTNGKFVMDVTDIRDAMLGAGHLEDRIRLFRAERLAKIAGGETPVPLEGTKLICIHLMPFEAFGPPRPVDLRLAASHYDLFKPFNPGGGSFTQFNIDGVYSHTSTGIAGTSHSYLHCFRNGILEAVDAQIIPVFGDKPDSLPAFWFAEQLFRFVTRCAQLQSVLEFMSPFAVLVSVLGAKGIPLATNHLLAFRLGLKPFDRDAIQLPEAVIDERPFDPAAKLKPVLDALWQAAGVGRCLDYDESGQWQAQA